MPIHLPPLSRRRFLGGVAAIGAGVACPAFADAADEARIDSDAFVLMSDLHISRNRAEEHHGANPAKALETVRETLLKMERRPSRIFVTGDCAANLGVAGDYAVLLDLVKPLRRAGMPIHIALGNHDRREPFPIKQFESQPASQSSPVPGKYVSVVETPHANWFLLDSLDPVVGVPGRLGEAQTDWLAKALDARADKPALVLAHHPPQDPQDMKDGRALLNVLEPRKHVKAFVFGHRHTWSTAKLGGLHLVCIPTTAWVFEKSQPRGFLTARLRSSGMELKVHALDSSHAKHGETVDLAWRTG